MRQVVLFVLGFSLFEVGLVAVDWRLAAIVTGLLVAGFALFVEQVDE